jgi:hypothetical protein
VNAVKETVESTKLEFPIPLTHAVEIARRNKIAIDPMIRELRNKILKSFLCGGHCAQHEETASQPSASEEPQVLEGEVILAGELPEEAANDVVYVGKDGNAGKTPALSREVVRNAVMNYLAMYSKPSTKGKGDKVVEVMVDNSPMFFDLEDPRVFQGLEYLMDSITKRVGDLARYDRAIPRVRTALAGQAA